MKPISPTPWIVRKFNLFEDGPNTQNGIEVTDAVGNAVCCNQTYYPTQLKPENANIIAAAPELLEALEKARLLLVDGWHYLYPNMVDTDDDEVISIMDAAIKKAKGE